MRQQFDILAEGSFKQLVIFFPGLQQGIITSTNPGLMSANYDINSSIPLIWPDEQFSVEQITKVFYNLYYYCKVEFLTLKPAITI